MFLGNFVHFSSKRYVIVLYECWQPCNIIIMIVYKCFVGLRSQLPTSPELMLTIVCNNYKLHTSATKL